jgi:hypothetical protein
MGQDRPEYEVGPGKSSQRSTRRSTGVQQARARAGPRGRQSVGPALDDGGHMANHCRITFGFTCGTVLDDRPTARNQLNLTWLTA